MISKESFEAMALSFPYTETKPHFDRIGFRVTGRRMFATYLEKDHTANIFLTPAEQKIFCEAEPENIFPVPNKWGEKGATTFVLKSVPKELLHEALLSAYNEVLGKGRYKNS